MKLPGKEGREIINDRKVTHQEKADVMDTENGGCEIIYDNGVKRENIRVCIVNALVSFGQSRRKRF